MEKELRTYSGSIEAQDEGVIFGYGAVFDSPSQDLGGFIETIDARAFDKILKDPSIMILANHDDNMVLGRTGAGTAEIGVDERGLWYKVTPPKTRADILESVKRGDMVGSSFGFLIDEEEWSESNGVTKRHIRSVKRVFDLGPVSYPAYLDTTTAVRNYRNYLQESEQRDKGGSNLPMYKIRLYENSIII